ncbi:MAG TPA: T9SS type A sorting domain-containing protein, partial [Bacteroidales bacterium]|nr:T9SS type A sorting domain-containing protein [Bacteroidales bacterium]
TTTLGGDEDPFYVVANNTFFSVTQNTNIKITFWAKAIPHIAGEVVEFTPFLQEADGNSFTNFEKTSVTSNWVEYTMTAEITSSTSDNYKFKFRIPSEGDIYIDNVTVELDTSTDVNTLEVSNSASIYPNPTSSILNIRSNSSMVKYSIYNLCGEKVLNGVGQQVDVSALETGMYMVTLDDGSHLKFIKE